MTDIIWRRVNVEGQHLLTGSKERFRIWDLLISDKITQGIDGDNWEYIQVKASLDISALGMINPCDQVVACDIDGKLSVPFMVDFVKMVMTGEQRVMVEGKCTTRVPKSWAKPI